MECEVNLRKAKQTYLARCEDYDKAKTAASRAEEEGGGSTAKSLEKKKRLEEEARNKVLISTFNFTALFLKLRLKFFFKLSHLRSHLFQIDPKSCVQAPTQEVN